MGKLTLLLTLLHLTCLVDLSHIGGRHPHQALNLVNVSGF
uniref:Uncharacterized protein MANES_06G110100 n=1 Tax=Rhizophora mucronata TaxID=61149 RepID=A0A2P2L8G7_RHIMU